jgi:hypothetical protein
MSSYKIDVRYGSTDPQTDQLEDEDRVSLAPLDPKEALRGLLAVKPDPAPKSQDPAKR